MADIQGKCFSSKRSSSDNAEFSVQLESSQKFTATSNPDIQGKIRGDHAGLVQALMDEKSLQLQISCAINTKDGSKPTRLGPVPIPCALAFILYGPMDLAEDVNDFFQGYDMYLQDPRGCDHNVKYINPQRLSAIDRASCPMTSALDTSNSLLESFMVQDVTKRPDILEMLDSSRDLPEATQPDTVQTQLKRQETYSLTMTCSDLGHSADTRSRR